MNPWSYTATQFQVLTKPSSYLLRAIGTEFSFEVDTDRIRESVMEREAIASTIVGNGVAIPHARIPGFEDLVVGLLILKTPLTHNEQPVQVFAMVLTSRECLSALPQYGWLHRSNR